MEVYTEEITLADAQVNLLAGALEVDGALPALTAFSVECSLGPGGPSKLARALKVGTAPRLRHLNLAWGRYLESDRNIIADMLEARAKIPGCERRENFELDGDRFDQASLGTRTRLLRILLPSLTEMIAFTWNQAFERCFLEVQAPYLCTLQFRLTKMTSMSSPGRCSRRHRRL